MLIDASFEWYLRNEASTSPMFILAELSEQDRKVEALLYALRLGIESGHSLENNLKLDDWGAIFIATVLSLRLNKLSFIEKLVEVIFDSPKQVNELYQAFAWQPPSQQQINSLLQSQASHVQPVVAAAFPSYLAPNIFAQCLLKSESSIVIPMLNYIGEQRLRSYIPYVVRYYSSPDENVQCAAACAGLLLGEGKALDVIKKFASYNNSLLRKALQWLFCFSPFQSHSGWLENIISMNLSPRIQALSIAYSGIVDYIPKLINIMDDINYAQVAGEAFSLLTGVNLIDNDLDDNAPKGEEPSGAEKRKMDSQYRDYEEDLPWPNVEKIWQWWVENEIKFSSSQCYLAGREINCNNLIEILSEGTQVQRHAAALALAKIQCDRPYFPCGIKAEKQFLLLIDYEDIKIAS